MSDKIRRVEKLHQPELFWRGKGEGFALFGSAFEAWFAVCPDMSDEHFPDRCTHIEKVHYCTECKKPYPCEALKGEETA